MPGELRPIGRDFYLRSKRKTPGQFPGVLSYNVHYAALPNAGQYRLRLIPATRSAVPAARYARLHGDSNDASHRVSVPGRHNDADLLAVAHATSYSTLGRVIYL